MPTPSVGSGVIVNCAPPSSIPPASRFSQAMLPTVTGIKLLWKSDSSVTPVSFDPLHADHRFKSPSVTLTTRVGSASIT